MVFIFLSILWFQKFGKKFKILVIIFKLKIKNSKKNCHYNVKICHKKEKKMAILVENFLENINENCKKKPWKVLLFSNLYPKVWLVAYSQIKDGNSLNPIHVWNLNILDCKKMLGQVNKQEAYVQCPLFI